MKRRASREQTQCKSSAESLLALTMCIGVSQFSGNESPDQTINRADAGLYQAKQAGRNRVAVAQFSVGVNI